MHLEEEEVEKDWAAAKGNVVPWGRREWEKVKENVRQWGALQGNADTRRSPTTQAKTEHRFRAIDKWKIHDCKELFNPVADRAPAVRSSDCHSGRPDTRVAALDRPYLAQQESSQQKADEGKREWEERACLMLESNTLQILNGCHKILQYILCICQAF